jgi:hypothetical protein
MKNVQNNIFCKNINSKYKLIPFNIKNNSKGIIKYFPADSKEWKNKIYLFNFNLLKNLSLYDININKLIKSYFNMYLKNNVLIRKYISRRSKRFSINKIYISRSEIKHTNSKVIITIYVFDREFLILLTKLNRRKSEFIQFIIKIKLKLRMFFKELIHIFLSEKNYIIYNTIFSHYKNIFKHKLYKELSFIRKHKLKLNFNILKFKYILIHKLSDLIGKIYKKNVEFNIINLQSIILSSDTITEFLNLKLRSRRTKPTILNLILKKTKLIQTNKTREINSPEKNLYLNLVENKYKNTNINDINNNNFNKILYGLYENFSENSIFNYIKYKNIGGIRLEIKGRLTKRYRADRSLYNVKLKGGLKNIDSSYKGLSTVNFRGYINSNIEYSIKAAKRRIGAFAVKG